MNKLPILGGGKMKAAVLIGKEKIQIEERPIPKAGPGQMVIKIAYVGICGTDIEFYSLGSTPTPLPKILGHENVGIVSEIGDGVTGFTIGDRVLCGPPTHCVEDCPSCRIGRTNICENGFMRTAGIGLPDGGYAEYMLIQDVEHTMIVKIPDAVNMEDAVLFDVICVALHGVRKSGFKIGDNVAVSGTGPIGLATIQFLKVAGANKIIALDIDDSKADFAKMYGADYFINTQKCEDLKESIREITQTGTTVDIVYECSGNPRSLENCIFKMVKPGGQVVMIGTVQEKIDFVPGMAQVFEPELIFSFVYIKEEVQIYLDMLASGKISFPGMVTDIISLDECQEKGLGRRDRSNQKEILIDPSF